MASILCKKCDIGIHYNSDPQGIEYIFIEKEKWKEICNSQFDPQKKVLDSVGYPRLYQADTIEEDFSGDITKVWKCPNCGSIIVFGTDGCVLKTYVETGDIGQDILQKEGIAFDDCNWDRITEMAKPDVELKGEMPTVYVKVFDDGILVSKEKSFDNPDYYKAI